MARPIYGKRGDAARRKRERGTVQHILERHAKGFNAASIARQLNLMGRKGPEGGKWTARAIERVIASADPAAFKRAQELAEKERADSEATKRALDTRRAGFFEGHELDTEEDEDTGEIRTLTPEQTAARLEQLRRERMAEDVLFSEPIMWDEWGSRRVGQEIPDLAPHEVARWFDPKRNRPNRDEGGPYGVALIVKELQSQLRRNVYRLLDQLDGPPQVKREAKWVVRALIREVAIQRQANLALRQRSRSRRP